MKKRLSIFSAAIVALAFAWFLLIYSPLSHRYEDIRQQSFSARAQLDDFSNTMKQLPTYLEQSHNLESFRNHLNSSLYAKDDILKLLNQLTADAVSHHLAVVEITPSVMELLELNRQQDLAGEPQFLNLTLDIRGQYIDFGRFVRQLETTPYFRAINHCSIRGGQIAQEALDFSLGFRAMLGTAKEPG